MSNKPFIKIEGFEYIERKGRDGVNAQEFADKFLVKLKTAQSWLSRWTTKGYLVHMNNVNPIKQQAYGRPMGLGRYKIDYPCKPWPELVFDNELT